MKGAVNRTMPDTMTVNDAEYTVLRLLGKGKGGYSYLVTDGAAQAAVRLLDWGVNTGLGTDEIGEAVSTWLAADRDGLTDRLQKLELVDDAYRKLLTEEARELLDSAGCAEVEITWGSEAVGPVEAVMQAAGLRG